MDPLVVGIIGVAVLVLGLFSGMPIAFVFALVGFGGFAYLVSVDAALKLMATDIFSTLSGYTLTVIPMFMLMGTFSFYSGASSRLYNAAYTVFGRFKGGLGISTIVAAGAFGAMCGSGAAATATFSKVALPEMRKRGYDPGLAGATCAAGGPLSVLIPPSAGAIIYCVMVGESISHMFIAGILPGIMKVILFTLVIYTVCRLNPRLGPAGGPSTIMEKLKSVGGVGEMITLFIIVMGGLFIGVFTPTEAGAVGAAGALIIGLVRRGLTRQGFVSSFADSIRLTTMLFLIIACAMIFNHFLVVTKVNFAIQAWLVGLDVPPIVVMWLIGLVFLVAGCFIEAIALILLLVPIFYPVAMELGFDPFWFGILVNLLANMGTITPPVGVGVYIVSGVAGDIPIETIFRGIVPFVIANLVGITLIMYIPIIVTFLPGFM